MIENQEYRFPSPGISGIEALADILEKKADHRLLRWYISRITPQEWVVEATLLEDSRDNGRGHQAKLPFYPGKSVVLSVVPTGVGCDIGGYAGDAAPATALLASTADYLVTNPNAVNASNFISLPPNVLYTEGFMIDLFCQGAVNLYQPYANRVGLIIERTEDENLDIVFNILNTVRAVYGIDIRHYVITRERLGARCRRTESGAYVGTLDRPGILFDACDILIRQGVNAIAITSNITDLPLDSYTEHFNGKHPNPIGGAEAVISHLVGHRCRVPAAHAPMINTRDMKLVNGIVDARGAGEYASTSGLACVLVGLGRAPQVTADHRNQSRIKDVVNIHNLLAVVAPATALGGIPMLYAGKYGIPLIAVRENQTILQVTANRLNLKNVIEVDNYPEAAGVIQALKNGISISGLYRPLETLRFDKQGTPSPYPEPKITRRT